LVWCLPFLYYIVSAPKMKQSDGRGTARWLCLVLATAAIVGMAPTLMAPGSTMRYLNDATPSLCMLASIGLFQKLSQPRGPGGGHAAIDAICLTALSVLFGFLISTRGPNNFLRFANPPLWHKLQSIRL
ncbi:MAG TPA: hypothetical protein VMD30_05340, partial [Tepidisphaeraceae bacterium]|nr:hypothetical protein [Tepidisphaeraceae bacterium]